MQLGEQSHLCGGLGPIRQLMVIAGTLDLAQFADECSEGGECNLAFWPELFLLFFFFDFVQSVKLPLQLEDGHIAEFRVDEWAELRLIPGVGNRRDAFVLRV